MVAYTKNTGGGDGDDTAVMIWQEREDADILNYDRNLKNIVYLTAIHMYNKMYNFPLVVVRNGVPIDYQIDDSRSEILSPISDQQAKRKLDLNDIKKLKENKAHSAKILAACEAVVAQSQKDNAPPEKSVFELMGKIAKSHDFVKKIEIDVSNLREKNKVLQAQMLSDPDIASEIEMTEINNNIV